MTQREANLLAFVACYQSDHRGASPSLDEMAAEMGLRSRSNAHAAVVSLERQGRIRRVPGQRRSIEITPQSTDLSSISDAEISREFARRFGGAVAAQHHGSVNL